MFIKERNSEENKQLIVFLSKKIEKWKKMKTIEQGGTILCRICEQLVQANKMMVNIKNLVIETYRIMLIEV